MSLKHILWGIAGIAVIGLLYLALATPPTTVPLAYPADKDHPELYEEFWKNFQSSDVSMVANTNCAEAKPVYDAEGDFQLADKGDETDTERLRDVICTLEELVAADPNNPVATVILSAMYMWRVQEQISPEHITPDLHKARQHANQSVKAGNIYAGGFEASPTWLLGFLLDDAALRDAAWQQMVDDTLRFTTFHGYVEGALLSGMINPENNSTPYDYNWALVSFQENIETCIVGDSLRGVIELPEGMRMNRFLFNVLAMLSTVSGRGWCYNSQVAPFNIQGLYITQGDAYLKKGDFKLAKVAYENALKSPNIENWDYADEVRYRLDNMTAARNKFLNDNGRVGVDQKPTAMVLQAEWYCASCHAHSQKIQ